MGASIRIVKLALVIGAAFSILISACTSQPIAPAEMSRTQSEETVMGFTLTSSEFAHGEPIPRQYTCDGDDVSPPLAWTDAPTDTASFALIMDDPDAPAGTWVHWVLFNLPVDLRSLDESSASDTDIVDGNLQGKNSWRNLGYGGPCPPGGTHRYYLTLYALDTTLDLESGASKAALLKAMESHILAQAVLMGTYTRD